MRSPQIGRGALAGGATLAAAIGMWLPAFFSPEATGYRDWPYFHHMWEAGYVALTRYGEWPLWDPYHCGGITIFGNPQSQLLSPFYLLALLLGPTLGSKCFLVLHAWAGFAGMYLLARRGYGLTLPGSLLASIAWAGSGFFAWHGSVGHSTFLPFYLTPLVLLAWRAAARDLRYAAAVAALLTLVLLEGGTYPFPFLALLLAFDALHRAWPAENRHGIVVAGLVSALLTALLGAIRLLPILDQLSRSPRTIPSDDGVSASEVLAMLTSREHEWDFADHWYAWHEYGAYVGWGVLGLALLGLVFAWRPPWRWVALGAMLFLGLTLGEHGSLSPWSLVHRLPIYESLRIPSRFAVFFTLYLALLAGRALDALAAAARRVARPAWLARGSALVPYFALCAIVVDLWIVQRPIIDHWASPPIVTDFVSPRYYLTSQHPYWSFYASFPRMNLGSRGCYEAMGFMVAQGLWSEDLPQAEITRGRGRVLSFGRTTSRVWAEVTLETDGRVLFNQNYAPGWRSPVGTVVSDEDRLALDLPVGTRRAELVYRPRTLLPGASCSLLGLLLGWAVAARRPRRFWRLRGPRSARLVGPPAPS